MAIEFVEDRSTRTFFDPARKIGPTLAGELLKHGVISRAMPQGDILGFAPPLCINQAEIDTSRACNQGGYRRHASSLIKPEPKEARLHRTAWLRTLHLEDFISSRTR
jgi:hypothetical protein